MSKKVLVVGATGTVGRHVVRGLVAAGETVKAVSRSEVGLPGVETVRLAYGDEAGAAAALHEVDRAYLMVPPGTLDVVGMVEPFVKAAAKQRVKVVFLGALGADADENNPYRQTERLLERSGTPFVVLRPNWFMDNFHTFWLAGIQNGVIALPAGEGRSSFIDARDIAASAVSALRSSAFDGQAVNLTGPEALGYRDAAAILSKSAGRPITYQPIDDASFIESLVSAGVPVDYARFLAMIFHPVREGWTAAISDGVQRMTDHPPRSLAVYAADYAKQFARSA